MGFAAVNPVLEIRDMASTAQSNLSCYSSKPEDFDIINLVVTVNNTSFASGAKYYRLLRQWGHRQKCLVSRLFPLENFPPFAPKFLVLNNRLGCLYETL